MVNVSMMVHAEVTFNLRHEAPPWSVMDTKLGSVALHTDPKSSGGCRGIPPLLARCSSRLALQERLGPLICDFDRAGPKEGSELWEPLWEPC